MQQAGKNSFSIPTTKTFAFTFTSPNFWIRFSSLEVVIYVRTSTLIEMIISINVFQTISLIALLLPTTKLVLAQDDRPFDNNNHFLPPWTAEKTITTDPQVWSKNPVYALGSRMTVSWTSNYSIVSLVVAKDGTSQTWWIGMYL